MIDEKKLIERLEALKDKCWNRAKKENNINFARKQLNISQIIGIINTQPKIGEWIPCSDKLPEYGKRYLITKIWRDGEFEKRSVYDAVYGSDGIWHTHNYKPINYGEVVAWQPLPEPYEE